MARRSAVYLRISKDDLGTGIGIERQRQAVKSWAETRGWRIDPAWVLEENEVSASAKKPGPQFERLLAGIASGEVTAVLALAMDRLSGMRSVASPVIGGRGEVLGAAAVVHIDSAHSLDEIGARVAAGARAIARELP